MTDLRDVHAAASALTFDEAGWELRNDSSSVVPSNFTIVAPDAKWEGWDGREMRGATIAAKIVHRDHAERILACVQACRGIPIDALRAGELKTVLANTASVLRDLREGFPESELVEPPASLLQRLERLGFADVPNPADRNGPEMTAAREVLARHGREAAQEASAVVLLDTLLQLSKSDAWNGSFVLDQALRAAREIVEMARAGGDPRLTTPAPEGEAFERILVLSDGETWETFDATKVRLVDVSSEGFDDLCTGSEPNDLSDAQILRSISLAEAAFGGKVMLAPAPDDAPYLGEDERAEAADLQQRRDRADQGDSVTMFEDFREVRSTLTPSSDDVPYDGEDERAEAAYLQQQRDRADQCDSVAMFEDFTEAHLQEGLRALRPDWKANFTDDALADAAAIAQQRHGALNGFTAQAALENAIRTAADGDDEPEYENEGFRP